MIRIAIKAVIVLGIVFLCSAVDKKKMPSLAGLISVMPLTGAMALAFVYTEKSGGDTGAAMAEYTSGAIWGIVPSILFFVVAYFCFKKSLSLPLVLCASFGVWGLGAAVHQVAWRLLAK